MRVGITVALLGAARAVSDDVESRFAAWAADYGKVYESDAEVAVRLANFNATLARIERLAASEPEATFGLNEFADWSAAEFRAARGGYRPPAGGVDPGTKIKIADPLPTANLSAAFDWRATAPKPVSPVKDQGKCGSCWAFSATEAVESAWMLAGKGAVVLAPEEIVSCDDPSQRKLDAGCLGGAVYTALEFVKTLPHGLATEADYPRRRRSPFFFLSVSRAKASSEVHGRHLQGRRPVQDAQVPETQGEDRRRQARGRDLGHQTLLFEGQEWHLQHGPFSFAGVVHFFTPTARPR